MRLIDSHVNLHAAAFDADRDDVIARARAAGVRTMIAICDRIENFSEVRAIAEADPDIWCTVGAHPHHASEHLALTAAHLAEFSMHPKVVAIGETGMDRHYNRSLQEDQEAVFRTHIAAARETGLPVIVHTRNADDDTARILVDEHKRGPFRLLMHCYTSGAALARTALELGAYFSLSGILTFRTAEDVRTVAAELPIDRLILETDCPYLAPAPHRGRRNEPALLVEIHRYFCAWRGLEETATAAIMTDNFRRLFPKASVT